ncbi:MgtC/SapB family protein [Candidatus Woesearchaeota archaeon]|nr:MgtC/SapB family protein [Candidatus Woesearchaeota archaeon]
MADVLVFTHFLVAIALGALMGMEREMAMWEMQKRDFAGVRTFVLITLFGALTAYTANFFQYPLVLISMALFGLILLVVASYFITGKYQKKIGTTTEMTALLAFIIGMMCVLDIIILAVSITILITIFLALKKILHGMAQKINRREMYSTLEFLLVTLVVLPFLPDKGYGPYEIFNPFNIWLMVVFIAAISYVGYILMKWKGVDKGVGITGFLGGLVSSTSVASSMANESKRTQLSKPFAFGTIVSSTTMFFRVMFIAYVLNSELLPLLVVPLGAMALSGALFALASWKKVKKSPTVEIQSPLTIVPAIKFALFFALVLYVSKIAQVYYGSSGIYVVALLAGLADLNAITISMAGLSLSGAIPVNAAVVAITLAIISNNVVKIWIGYLFGTRDFSRRINVAYVVTLLVGLAALFFI